MFTAYLENNDTSAELTDALADAFMDVVRRSLEIHITILLANKYKKEELAGEFIFTLPDNTVTGDVNVLLTYLVDELCKQKRIGGNLLRATADLISRIDVDVAAAGGLMH